MKVDSDLGQDRSMLKGISYQLLKSINGASVSVYATSRARAEVEAQLDCRRVAQCLLHAVEALSNGDGVRATNAAAEAFARLALFRWPTK